MSSLRDDEVEPMEYVLALHDPAERRAFELALLDDPDLARSVWRAEEMLSPFLDALKPQRPPARVRRAIERRLFADERAARPKSRRFALAFWRGLCGLLGLVTVAACALIAVLVMRPEVLLPQQPLLVAAIVGADGGVTLARVADDGTLVTEPFAAALPAGRDPELWFVREGEAPISMGLLSDDAKALIALRDLLSRQDLRDLQAGQLVVTDEPEGGSPSGAPTGPAIAQGALREI